MKKIDISLIKKYVNGEDLGEYSIEELENNTDFMISVISYTNDFKIYDLCSDKLKKDYDFVKQLVLKFQKNPDFIIKIADYFLDNTNTDLDKRELSIIMEEILPNKLSTKYKVLNESSYYTKRLEIEIEKAKDSKLETMLGMGFLLIFDSYNGNDIILNYYAKSMIDEIIRDNNINFETMLHNQFKTPDKIDEIGVNNYIINFIGYYDSMLSSYVSTHLDLISNIANEIKSVQTKWDKYKLIDEAKRYNSMLGMVHEYMNESESSMSETDILYFVAKELGIKDKVEYYDNPFFMDDELSINFDDDVVDDIIKPELEYNLKEKQVYLNVRKIMLDQLFSSTPADLYSIIGEKGKGKFRVNTKCKIIELKRKYKK